MNIICNTHEIEEKEIACRCLYQYCNDIPYFLWEYSSLMIQSLESSIVSQLHKSEDLFIIISAIIILTIKMCLKYSIRNDIINVNDSNDHNNNNDRNNDNNNKEIENINIMNNITIKSLTHWNIALRQTLYFSQSSNSNDNNINNNNNNSIDNNNNNNEINVENPFVWSSILALTVVKKASKEAFIKHGRSLGAPNIIFELNNALTAVEEDTAIVG